MWTKEGSTLPSPKITTLRDAELNAAVEEIKSLFFRLPAGMQTELVHQLNYVVGNKTKKSHRTLILIRQLFLERSEWTSKQIVQEVFNRDTDVRKEDVYHVLKHLHGQLELTRLERGKYRRAKRLPASQEEVATTDTAESHSPPETPDQQSRQ